MTTSDANAPRKKHQPPVSSGRPKGSKSVWRFRVRDIAEVIGLTPVGTRQALRRGGHRLADGAAGIETMLRFIAPRLGFHRETTEEATARKLILAASGSLKSAAGRAVLRKSTPSKARKNAKK